MSGRKDIKYLSEENPELAKEWHPTKNGDRTPKNTGIGSSYKAWWFYPYDDPKTGKHFDFEWQARVDNRHYQRLQGKGGCPFLSNEMVWTGYNDLATIFPDIAAEWDYEKNKEDTPETIAPWSNKKRWWSIDYKKKNGEIIRLSWDAPVCDRAQGKGCPYIGLCPKRVLVGFNDLESQYPELAKQWSPKNTKKPSEVMKGCNKKFWWRCEYYDERSGGTFIFEWETAPLHRNSDGSDCPFLANKKVCIGYNDLASLFPEIAAEWDYERNGKETPETVTYASQKKYYWKKDVIEPKTGKLIKDYSWCQTVYARTAMGRDNNIEGSNQFSLIKGLNDLATVYPDVAKEWNYKRNGNLSPDMFQPGSPESVWWVKKVYDEDNTEYDYEFKMTIRGRTKGEKPMLLSKKSSNLLKKVFFACKRLGYDVFTEYAYEGLCSEKPLLFDLFLPVYNMAIEVDGSQHFDPKFGQTEEQFAKLVENDNMKNDFCKEKGIKLLRIPFDYTDSDTAEIETVIKDFFDNNRLPEKIVKKYDNGMSNYQR